LPAVRLGRAPRGTWCTLSCNRRPGSRFPKKGKRERERGKKGRRGTVFKEAENGLGFLPSNPPVVQPPGLLFQRGRRRGRKQRKKVPPVPAARSGDGHRAGARIVAVPYPGSTSRPLGQLLQEKRRGREAKKGKKKNESRMHHPFPLSLSNGFRTGRGGGKKKRKNSFREAEHGRTGCRPQVHCSE